MRIRKIKREVEVIRIILITVSILLVLSAFMSCAQPAKVVSPPEKQPAPVVEPKPVLTGWEAEWEKILAEARKEGRVVVYGGSAAVALKLHATKLIKEKFGFDLDVLALRGAEVRPKMISERSRGLFIPDVYTSGVSDIYDTLKKLNAVDPIEPELILPEVLDPKVWYGGKLPWGDEEHKVFIWAGFPLIGLSINNSIVRPEEMKSYYELLNPKWKGKIVVNDPTIEGNGQNSFVSLLYNKMVDVDFFRQLVKNQELTVLRDQHLQIMWLIRGKFPIALWASTGRMEEYIKAGAPISLIIPKEGTDLSGGGAGVALINKAPHPNAARIFLNWLFSKEGQLVLQNGTGKQSSRLDVPTHEMDPSKIRQPGVKYFPDPNNNEKFVLEEREKYVDLARELFGPLLR